MTFDEILEQVITLLKRQGRVSYGAIKRRFELDDAYLEDLKGEILFAYPVSDENDQGLVWTDEVGAKPESTTQRDQTSQQPVTQQDQPSQTELPPPEPALPDAERRQITVMFSDLVDSTKLSGQLDPEDYREVLRSYQAACSEAIHRFDGYIAQHLGDALLVYFGFPHAHEDDARRAIHTGLGMLASMKSLNERLVQEKGIRLSIRVGIHTGLTVVSDVGSGQKHETLALGEAPNVASRIQGLAQPDTIAISSATFRLVEGYFDCDDLGLHTLKGVAEPQQVYCVIGESGAQSRLEVAATRGLTPLVGREQEVGLLLERWSQAQNGHGQVVLLSGEGGIGKSRLLQVLKDHVADEPHTQWECRSSPYYQNTALYPITDLLQRTLQFQTDDTPEQRLEKLGQELSRYRLPLEESVPLFAPLLSLSVPETRYLPLQWSPQRQRQKTLESIVSILLEQAEQQPVLFILEDLHWTDPTTLELLDLLIDQAPTASIYTLLTCRPTFQPTWSHRSYLTEMTVSRLSQQQIVGMAEQVAGGKHLPEAVLLQITERTDGVPLFVEEMTKAVLESGHLKEDDGHYELTGSLSSLAIPATLQDSLMARLDRLMTAKVIAQLGAVIGRQFSYELLHAVSQLDEMTLQRELRRLVEAELLYQRGLPPQATYTFKHALIQDTAYESLLRNTRQQYHQRIGQVLEEQFPETTEHQPELLAHHYTEAGLHDQAVNCWRQAGEKAVERSSYREATAYFTKGLDVLQALPDSSHRTEHELILNIALGSPLQYTMGHASPDAKRVYQRALSLCQQVGDRSQHIKILLGLRAWHHIRGELQTAWHLGQQALNLVEPLQDTDLSVQICYAAGHTLCYMGAFNEARLHLEKGARLYTNFIKNPSKTHTLGIVSWYAPLAWSLWYLGYPDQALARIQEALVIGRESLSPADIEHRLSSAAIVHQLRGEWDNAQAYIEQAVIISKEQSFRFRLAWSTLLQGWILGEQGQVHEGIRQMSEGLADYRATGAQVAQPWFLIQLATMYSRIEEWDTGQQFTSEAMQALTRIGQYFYEAELHRLKGQLLLQQSSDNHAEAESCFHQAITIAENQQAKSWELRAATSLARLWQSQDKRKDAHDLLATVYGWFTEGSDTADLIDAKALIDELK